MPNRKIQSKFLGADGKYHPMGSFLGADGKYHPQGSFMGINGYVEPEGLAKEEKRNQGNVTA